jgi:hypothetical protein
MRLSPQELASTVERKSVKEGKGLSEKASGRPRETGGRLLGGLGGLHRVQPAFGAPRARGLFTLRCRGLSRLSPLDDEEYAALAQHGERVRRHAGRFP